MKLGASSPPHSALVGVDELVGHRRDLVRVAEQAGDELPADLGELVLRALFVERVDVALEQRHVGVHAAAGLAAHRLGHERGVDALLDRDLFDHGAERHDVVRRGEGVRVAQVDLVLARAALVVAELDRDAEVFQHAHGSPAEVVGRAAGHVVEVTGRVDRLGAVRAEGRRLEEVELDLGVRVERETGVGGLRQRPLQDVARIGDGGLTVGRRDVAEHPRGRVDLAPPGQDLERGGVGVREQVRFVRPRQALDRGAVEAQALAESALDLCGCDGHRLQRADHVCEPQSYELHASFFDGPQNEVTLLVHRVLSGAGIADHGCLTGVDARLLVVARGSRHRVRAPGVLARLLGRPRARTLPDHLGRLRGLLRGVERAGAVRSGRLEALLDLAGLEVVPVLLAVAASSCPPRIAGLVAVSTILLTRGRSAAAVSASLGCRHGI